MNHGYLSSLPPIDIIDIFVLELNVKFKLTQMDDIEDNFGLDYDKKAEHLINTLDLNKLSEIKKKDLKALSDSDLEFIGFNKITHDEIPNLYCFEDLDHIKVYVNKVDTGFELRGYMLRKMKDINTTTELLDETLTKWKLKM